VISAKHLISHSCGVCLLAEDLVGEGPFAVTFSIDWLGILDSGVADWEEDSERVVGLVIVLGELEGNSGVSGVGVEAEETVVDLDVWVWVVVVSVDVVNESGTVGDDVETWKGDDESEGTDGWDEGVWAIVSDGDQVSLGVEGEWLLPSESVGADVGGSVVETVGWVELKVGSLLTCNESSLERVDSVVKELLVGDETVELVGILGEDWGLVVTVIWVGDTVDDEVVRLVNLSELLLHWLGRGVDALDLGKLHVGEWNVVGSGHGDTSDSGESSGEFHLFFV